MVSGNFGKVTAILIVLIMLLSSSMSLGLGLGASEKVDVLIGFHNMSERAQNRAMVRAFGGEIYAEFNLVDVIAARMTPQQILALSKNPKIDYIEPDAQVYALEQSTPWGIDRVFGSENYSFDTWNNPTPGVNKGAGIGVAVLDTGIDVDHEDLNVVGGKRFYLRGLTLRSDDLYDDVYGHGTHVAGTIAALDNSIGVVGVAPEVDLYAVKVLGDNGSGSTSAIIAGIQWACDQVNISIINMSLGSSLYSTTFKNACDNAYYNEGILIVASAGNSGNVDGTGDNVGYPAKYDSVIAVAASDSNDERAYFSSTGPKVELIAPGVNIMSTVPGSLYEGGWNGTSMASPHVAGTAALVWAANPSMSNIDVRAILKNNTENLGLPLYHQGNGLVRADLAVDAVTAPVTQYTLTVGVVGEGTTTPAVGTHVYNEGSSAVLSAVAADGHLFEKWVINGVDSTLNPMSVTMNSDITAVAHFKADTIVPVTDLSAAITSPAANTSYKWNALFYITVEVKDQNSAPVSGASVSIDVLDPNSVIVKRYTGVTNTLGVFSTAHKVVNKALPGDYTIEASASLVGLKTTSIPITFNVTGK